MKTEHISDAMNLLDEDMVKHTDELRRNSRRKAQRSRAKWCAMAAGLCLICVGALAAAAGSQRGGKDSERRPSHAAVGQPTESTEPTEAQRPGETQQRVVAVASLLATDGNYLEMLQRFATIPVEEYTGVYNEIPSVEEDILSASIGTEVAGADGWYRIFGHEDLQYLIRKEEQGCSLWKFESFSGGEYLYRDVLRLVYHVDSAEQIREIEVNPSRRDNSDEGKRIQEEIGTHSITDAEKIGQIYQIIAGMTCYGSNNWDRIKLGDGDAAADTGASSGDSFRLERYLSFTTDYGNEIDGLKYAGCSGMFFEFGGIAYEPLTAEQAARVAEILGI